MTTFIHITTLAFTTLLWGCNGQTNNQQSVTSKTDTTIQKSKLKVKDNPRDFIKNYNGENNKLFVFVGQKISVDELPYREGSMDGGFKAKYLVLQKVNGNFSHDTIEFVAYDHYGIPPFSEFKNVLLFVSADRGLYYHQKYMYNDVYLTKEGKWAGSYAKQDYGHEYNKNTKVKPIKIEFAKEVSYDIKNMEKADIQVHFPEPYYKNSRNRAIAIYGNYVDELFILKRDGYLTAREIFENGKLKE